MTSEPLLVADDLTVQYRTANGWLTAVSNASFEIPEGEYFGLVGESGCGKTTVANSIMGSLDQNSRIESGEIRYKGEALQDLSKRELKRRIRWKEIAYIPQSSMNSLNPLQRVSDQALEIANVHTDLSEEEAIEKFKEMFDMVGLPESRISDYPHQFSGGMQQRAIIALALFLEPDLIIADEPTTALDVIMQDMIFKYFDKIKEALDTSMLLITHDISLVLESCERMAIMHAGQVAETADTLTVHNSPSHPYTIMLKRSFPDIRYPERKLNGIDGSPPQSLGEVNYCTYANRCPMAVDECRNHEPTLESMNEASETESTEHHVACFRRTEANEIMSDADQLEEQ